MFEKLLNVKNVTGYEEKFQVRFEKLRGLVKSMIQSNLGYRTLLFGSVFDQKIRGFHVSDFEYNSDHNQTERMQTD